jgi:hypothetical protein
VKSTQVRSDGAVVCPKCGGTSFTQKRTVKGKILLTIWAPKRLKCSGCGANLKRG